MKLKFASIALIAFLTSVAGAQEPKRFGSLTYPAPGNIQLDEGTVEIWVISNFDTDVPKSPHQLTFFDLKVAPEEPFHYYFGLVGGSFAQIGFTSPRQSYVWTGPAHWKANEKHSVAWSWSGRTRSVFLDGKVIESGRFDGPLQGEGRGRSSANVVVEGWLHGNLSGGKLIVGISNSFMTVDEVRISSIARSPEELARTHAANAPPARDAFTLLLDHCDGGDAEVISGFNGEKGGVLSGGYKIVDGRFGKAIQLWTD